MPVSIIVPVWNEAPIIVDFLAHLRQRAPGAEVVVVDGGSSDGTLELSRHTSSYAFKAPLGRAKQMNAGAKIATGDVLWFVHADSRIASNSLPAIEGALADPKVAGGCFRLRIHSARWIYRLRDFFGNALVGLTKIALGDRGIFCRREVFERIGGYPEIAILEDAELYRALRSFGRVVQLPLEIGTSARRYEALGPVRTVCFYALIMALYSLRVPVPALERMVLRRGIRSSDRSSASATAKNRPAGRTPDQPRAPSTE